MKFASIGATGLLVFLFLSNSAPWAEDANGIMAKVDDQYRLSHKTEAVKIKLTTCKYKVNQGSMSCTENPRVVVYENVFKRYGAKNRDTRAVASVLEPASDKGIGMLTYMYDDPRKDNDNWLYLSALGKVKRLVSSSEGSEESASFFGSEFSLDESESIETREVGEYAYRITGEETYQDRLVWIIESVPLPERAKKTKYGKFLSWVDKEKYIILKENLFDRKGELYKQRLMRNVDKIDGVWIARKVTMNNLPSRRLTNMELIQVAFNMDVSDELLTQRALTDFAFKEKNLDGIRKKLK